MGNGTILQFVVIKAKGTPMVSGVTFDTNELTVQDMCDLRDEIDKRLAEMAKHIINRPQDGEQESNTTSH